MALECRRGPGNAAVGREQLTAEECRGQERGPAAVDRRGKPGGGRGRDGEDAALAADAEEPSLGEDEAERGPDDAAVRLRRRSGRAHLLAGCRHRQPGIAEVDARPAAEHHGLRPERGQRGREALAREQEIVDCSAVAVVDDLEAEDVDAVRREMCRHRGQAPRAGRGAGAARAPSLRRGPGARRGPAGVSALALPTLLQRAAHRRSPLPRGGPGWCPGTRAGSSGAGSATGARRCTRVGT